MAFNLNKNEAPEIGLSPKRSGVSGFNLSKQEAQTTTPATQRSSNTKNWLIGLVGVIIVGIGIWYYSSSKKVINNVQNATTDSATVLPKTEVVAKANVVSNITSDTVKEETIAQQSVADSNDETISELDHKVPVTFAKGSSTFMSTDRLLIKQIITYLKDNPKATIQVDGYASSDGPLSLNQTISQARADAFKQFLISKNIAATRIGSLGKGIKNPIASNDNKLGRKRNRRIEVIFP